MLQAEMRQQSINEQKERDARAARRAAESAAEAKALEECDSEATDVPIVVTWTQTSKLLVRALLVLVDQDNDQAYRTALHALSEHLQTVSPVPEQFAYLAVCVRDAMDYFGPECAMSVADLRVCSLLEGLEDELNQRK